MSYALRACCLLLAGALLGLAAVDLPPVRPVADQAGVGVGIQRTMTLLATSTHENRKRVRILFYGQSITDQPWTGLVEADLRQRFPHADLQVANKAISGFASQLLVKIAEHDVFAFQPDLVVFHVYGAHDTYEDIIRAIRTRTSAEVLLQTDHIGVGAESDWTVFMNGTFLPDLASRYGCGLGDVRSAWRRYLDDNALPASELLSDDIHPDADGNRVMAEIIAQYLVHRPGLPDGAWRELTRDVAPTGPGNRLTVSGVANGFELLVGAVAAPLTVTVTIDGKRPSEFPGCYLISRPTPPPPLSPVSLIRVDHAQPLLVEDWTLTITSVSGSGATMTWGYSVRGSRTGPDGVGSSNADFTSTSGRVVIKAGSWFTSWVEQVPPVGTEITWRVVPMFADQVELGTTSGSVERFRTLALGVPHGQHTLVLSGSGDLGQAIAAVRLHRPMGETSGGAAIAVHSDDTATGGGAPGGGGGGIPSAGAGAGGGGSRGCGLGGSVALLGATLAMALTARRSGVRGG